MRKQERRYSDPKARNGQKIIGQKICQKISSKKIIKKKFVKRISSKNSSKKSSNIVKKIRQKISSKKCVKKICFVKKICQKNRQKILQKVQIWTNPDKKGDPHWRFLEALLVWQANSEHKKEFDIII